MSTAAPTTKLPPSSITVKRISTPEEFSIAHEIAVAAFGQHDSLYGPVSSRPEWNLLESQQAASHPSLRFYLAFDNTTGRALGYAKWNFVRTPSDAAVKEVAPVGCDPALRASFFGSQAEKRLERWEGGKLPFAHMWVLCVSPDAQKRGVGKQLLKVGLEDAEKEGFRYSYIEGGAKGKVLYERMGWKSEGKWESDVSGFGTVKVDLMVRDAEDFKQ